jgi:hypothetical protein
MGRVFHHAREDDTRETTLRSLPSLVDAAGVVRYGPGAAKVSSLGRGVPTLLERSPTPGPSLVDAAGVVRYGPGAAKVSSLGRGVPTLLERSPTPGPSLVGAAGVVRFGPRDCAAQRFRRRPLAVVGALLRGSGAPSSSSPSRTPRSRSVIRVTYCSESSQPT